MDKLNYKNLKELREQIVLGSLFLNDYENDFISKENAFHFFDGFLEELEYKIKMETENYNDKDFYKYLPLYDTIEDLQDYFIYNEFSYIEKIYK